MFFEFHNKIIVAKCGFPALEQLTIGKGVLARGKPPGFHLTKRADAAVWMYRASKLEQ